MSNLLMVRDDLFVSMKMSMATVRSVSAGRAQYWSFPF